MKIIAIIVCKIAAKMGRILGKGTSLPGALALKICPNILRKMDIPKTVIAVTGSNGKTTTVELMAQIFEHAGHSVCLNREGSNQTEGVVTALIRDSTLFGRVKSDLVLLENDEQYARLTFKHLKPSHFIVLNLLRDQLTRNGHPQYIYDKIADALYPEIKLLLNADDPLVSRLATEKRAGDTAYFGVAKSGAPPYVELGMYNDGVYCPICAGELEYAYKTMAHFGSYRCKACGYSRADAATEVTAFDLESGRIAINEELLCSSINSMYHAYNIAAAFAVAGEIGIDSKSVAAALTNYFPKNGRIRSWELNSRKAVLLISKHENSVSYNTSIEYTAKQKCDVLIIVDAVSRKYFTGETSWLWDINFEPLSNKNVGKIYIAGKYVYDIAERLAFSAIDQEKITLLESLDEVSTLLLYSENQALKAETNDFGDMKTQKIYPQKARGGDCGAGDESKDLYVITCFSDREKFISRLPDKWKEVSL